MKKVYLFLSLLLVGVLAHAGTIAWKSATTGGAWSTNTNWVGDVVPGAGDDVQFNNTTSFTVTLSSSVPCRSLSIQGTANVTLSASGAFTVTLGAATPALNINASRALTLTGATTASSQGVILSIPTGGTATINGSLNLAGFSNAITTQQNQLLSVDAGSVIVASGGAISYNNNNSSTPFGTVGANTGVIVFQSGSIFNAYSAGNAFGNTSGAGIPTFQQGSTFNLFGGTAMGAAGGFANGRTYGKFVMGNGGTGGAQTNTTNTTTTFLDSLVVSSGTLTLTNDGIGTASPTYSFGSIIVRASAAAANNTLSLRTNVATDGVNATFNIAGSVQVIAGATTTSGNVTFTIGPNGVGSGTSNSQTNVTFTGAASAISVIKQSGAGAYPNLVIGTPTGGSPLLTNITVANGASLSLDDSLTLRSGTTSGTILTIKPTGKLVVSGTNILTTNGNLVIESDATGTGSIGNGTGSILNSATVQRYVPGNRAWRTIGFPFSTASTVTGTNLVAYVTTPARAYYYNEAADDQTNYGTGGASVNAGWTAFTSSTSISPRNGVLLWGTTTPQTVSMTGFLNYGDQSIPLTKTAAGWNLVANPYASNITWTSIQAANTGVLASSTVYRVNPLGNGAYSFSSYVAGGTGTNGGSDVIENGASFFVKASTAGNLTITESDKTTSAVGSTAGGVTLMGANDNYNSIRINLKGENTFSDEVVFVWGRFSKATEGFDADLDAYDLGASGTHDLSIVGKDDVRYSIFNGADLSKTAETRTYKLATKSLKLGKYEFSTSMPKELDRNNEAYIVDNYLRTSTLVKEGLIYKFEVTTDLSSKAEDRFQLEIRKKLSLSPIDAAAVASSKTYLLGNPSINNQVAIHFGQDAQTANWQLVDLSGRVISGGVFNNVYQGDTRVCEVKSMQSGSYLVRLFNDNEPVVVMKWVKF